MDHRKQMNMKFVGELQSILPFFYIISIYLFFCVKFKYFKIGFCKDPNYKEILNELIKLLISVFKNKMENQTEAIRTNFFAIVGQHISEINISFFNHNTIQCLAELKHVISSSNQKLLDQVKEIY